MALLSVIVAIDEVRAWVPAAILSASMVPFATAALAVGSVRWALPRKAWTAIDDCMYRTYMRLTLFVFETTSGVQLHLYGDVAELKRARESALVISNHQSNCDWAVVNMLAARQSPEGAETGLRFVMKYAISFVPLFGWYVFQHGYIYVRRFGNFTPAPLLRQFAHLRELGTPFWLHIFPEGTRFSKKKQDKIDASQKFAQERNLPIPQFTLIPRAGAFTLAVSELRDSLDAVYDLTIAYGQTKSPSRHGRAPNMFEFVAGPALPTKDLHVHIRRIPIADVPSDKSDARAWLLHRFQTKDDLLKQFHAGTDLPELIEANAAKLPILRTGIPFLIFASAIALPFFSSTCRRAYAYTVAASPLLILWLHVRKCV